MKTKLLLIFALIFLVVPFVSAYSQGQSVNFRVPCDKLNCSNPVFITVENPNSSLLVDNQTMTPMSGYQNFSFIPNTLGTYHFYATSNQAGLLGDIHSYDDGSFIVTKTGEDTSNFDYLPIVLIVLGIIGVLLYVGSQFGNEQAFVKSIMMILPLFFLVGLSQIGKSYIDNVYGSGAVTQILTPIMIILPWLAFGFMTYLAVNLVIKAIDKIGSNKRQKEGYDD